MLNLLLSRLATAIPSIVGVVIVTFMLTRLLPGDPAAYFAGLAASPQAIAEIRTKLGLDKSLPEQFVGYIGDLLHGNLGNSLSTGQPVVTEIATRLPASAELTLFALIVAVVIAIPLGVLAARWLAAARGRRPGALDCRWCACRGQGALRHQWQRRGGRRL